MQIDTYIPRRLDDTFIVAFISLAALRNFGPVLNFIGAAIFGAVGLTIAGAILGATI